MTAQQLMSLGVLWQKDGLSLGEFARRAGMGKAAAVTMIRRLERMEMVTKTADPTDGRLNVLKLTSKAREMAPDALAVGAAFERDIEQAVGKEDLDAMIKGLKAIQNMGIQQIPIESAQVQQEKIEKTRSTDKCRK
ncbi:MarR family transcriptional regulator [Desulfobacterales bacterium HSG16]|nr:MarR family transcriptional regulator [Desulfobacterales bacterium HSG16]